MTLISSSHAVARLLVGIAFAGAAGLAQAQLATGTLAGWGVYGDAVSQGGAITLTTAYLDGDTDEPFNLSGVSAADMDTLESAAGVGFHGLDLSPENYGTEGSLVSQRFTVAAGQTLSFDWSFATTETLLDRAFVVIDGQVFTLATGAAPGAASQRFSFAFAASGPTMLAFGVIDTLDVIGVSSLRVSNLVVSAVPEPATTALLLAGLTLLGATRLNRRDGGRAGRRGSAR